MRLLTLLLILSAATLSLAAEPTTTPIYSALAEVNQARARRGLHPFRYDHGLTIAANRAANYRAARGIQGHIGGSRGDFAMLPAGTHATTAGCAAWPASFGWGSCCTYEQHTYAGAAWVRGRDGRRYMHLFVR